MKVYDILFSCISSGVIKKVYLKLKQNQSLYNLLGLPGNGMHASCFTMDNFGVWSVKFGCVVKVQKYSYNFGLCTNC